MTPSGNELILEGMKGTEMIGGLYQYELAVSSDTVDLTPGAILGQNITLLIVFRDGQQRYYNGTVSRFESGEEADGGRREYNIWIVPDLWFFSRNSNSRIFQDKTVGDIVAEILQDAGIHDYQLDLEGEYPRRECVMQYNESDFQFVSRLMEEEGMYYYFEHDDGSHTMVITDSQEDAPFIGQIEFSGGSANSIGGITQWSQSYQFLPGKFTLADYNFETPSLDLLKDASIDENPAFPGFEVYEYPGLYETQAEGDRLAELRIQEIHSGYAVARGISSASQLTSGHLFTLTEHPIAHFNGKYLITSVKHNLAPVGNAGRLGYTAEFECIPESTVFRPERKTPRPVINGPQTAEVTGPAGEEIYTDEYGRVKVKFHWDRDGQEDENSSCWIRVVQPNAEGILLIPKIGWEVLVEFLDGNPDRPVVGGRLYNGDYPPPE